MRQVLKNFGISRFLLGIRKQLVEKTGGATDPAAPPEDDVSGYCQQCALSGFSFEDVA